MAMAVMLQRRSSPNKNLANYKLRLINSCHSKK